MSQRILGFDVARALAVFGMVIVNFKLAMAMRADPHWLADLAGLLEGRAAATFVVLAGIGLSLLSKKAREANDVQAIARHRDHLLKRALLLFVIGLLYTPIWPADILHFYGIYITVGAVVLSVSSRRLMWLAGAFTLTFVGLILVFDYERAWNWETLQYADLWTLQGMVRHLFFNGFHPVFPWTAFLLVGLVIGRLDLRDAIVRRRVLIRGITVAAIAEACSAVLIRVLSASAEAGEVEVVQALFGTAPMPPMPLYILAGAGTATAVIAACVGLTEWAHLRHKDTLWLRSLVATGQLALTLYVAHVLVGMGTLDAIGRLEDQSVEFAILSALIFCAAAVVFASLWRRRFRRGPLEWLIRRATRWPNRVTR